MSTYFDNKIIWITGASSGIGEALVYELAKTSAKIILSSRREEELKKVATNAVLPEDRFLILPMDLQNYKAMPELAKQAIARFGKIDLLINNAGLSQRSLAMDTDIEVDKKLMDTDYLGTVALTKAVVPYLLQNGGGQIAVVTSLMGVFSSPLRSSYCGAKHALHGFFNSLRAELYNDKVLVTIVCPGFIQTNVSINAITGTGAAQGTMDNATANGMPASTFAQKMLSAIAQKKEEVAIGGKETLGVYLKRLSPKLLSKMIRTMKVV
ncbi:MAG TPA: SDR family oxidoreductase [Chitinophagales bacterium]